MITLSANKIKLSICEEKGCIASLCLDGVERCAGEIPLFVARLRDKDGEPTYVNATEAKETDGLTYKNFGGAFSDLTFTVTVTASAAIEWRFAVSGIPADYALEWIECPKVKLPRLIANDERGGTLLFPYNEGMLVTDETLLPRYEPEFPSSGAYYTFPNMVVSQFMAYLFEDGGLYFGAHDPKRAPKCVDFYPSEGGLALQMRLYSGVDYGEAFVADYPIVWQACPSNWKSAAQIYRTWFESDLPHNLIPLKDNRALPEWYENAPLVVTYPVRGVHDMDKMEPNALFPYTNALPILNRIKSDTDCRILALLMHWEGTAPWAPPYVWPPFGGEALFNEFRDALHARGDLLGVYCSGFGYTLRSTLIESYHCEDRIEKDNVLPGVCHSPANKPELGRTCTPYQRYGYDLCPVSPRGREIIEEGFAPLFASGIDYAQILDQNHGGGQYLCYAREHGHPPMPGEWMTTHMQTLLKEWNEAASGILFGCEGAASEPFIGNLLMSDNRFELNYPYGTPVPLYAFLYHEYVRNFMGNQCGCPFEPACDTLRYRLAYAFSIGDLMTLILAPGGGLMSHWGTQDFEHGPDWEKTMRMIKNVTAFYQREGKKYLFNGKMSVADDFACEEISIPQFRGQPFSTLPRLLCSAWEAEGGKTAYVVVNPEEEPVSFRIGTATYQAPALSALLVEA